MARKRLTDPDWDIWDVIQFAQFDRVLSASESFCFRFYEALKERDMRAARKPGAGIMAAMQKRYRCQSCKKDFTIRTGTLFGESKLPLRKWFMAIYLLSTSGKGISSVQLANQSQLR